MKGRASAMREVRVSRPGGRIVAAREEGDLTGRPVFTLHGTPGSRFCYPPHIADARRQGIRLIGYDRPGYGESTPQRGRRLEDVPADVAAIADHLGLERFGVWGHSGGGAPAIACAALLPRRVVGAACLAGTAPPDADGIDRMAGLGDANREDYELMHSDPARWEAKLQDDAAMIRNATPDQVEPFLDSLLSDLDRKALTPELAAFFARQGREACRRGPEGMRDDALGDELPWRFDPGAIHVPLQVWHGAHDKFVPFAHGQWLAAHLPGAERHLLADEGHLTLYQGRIPEVHEWLLSRF